MRDPTSSFIFSDFWLDLFQTSSGNCCDQLRLPFRLRHAPFEFDKDSNNDKRQDENNDDFELDNDFDNDTSYMPPTRRNMLDSFGFFSELSTLTWKPTQAHATTGMDDTQVPPRGPWRGIRLEVDVARAVVVDPNTSKTIPIHPKTIPNHPKPSKNIKKIKKQWITMI